jgi:hypothetical protein
MAGAYPIEAPFRCSTLGYASGLAHKEQTRLERIAKNKHSSLLQKIITYGCRRFYGIGPSTTKCDQIELILMNLVTPKVAT